MHAYCSISADYCIFLEGKWQYRCTLIKTADAIVYKNPAKPTADFQRLLCVLVATGRQHRGRIMSQNVTHSLVLLKMGKIISRNMLG